MRARAIWPTEDIAIIAFTSTWEITLKEASTRVLAPQELTRGNTFSQPTGVKGIVIPNPIAVSFKTTLASRILPLTGASA
jgi:hypothetical protein